MKYLLFIIIFFTSLSNKLNSQIIDFTDNKGNTGFSLNTPVDIPFVKDKISIFIFEKRSTTFDPSRISISEQLGSCNIDFDKFIIYRFNLITGTCNAFDSIDYVLNGSIWHNKPKSMAIAKHFICISIPDTSTYNLILRKFGEDAINSNSMRKYLKKINYPNSIAFVSFDDSNKKSLESKLFELISINDLEEANKKISALNDSLSNINKRLIELKSSFKLALFKGFTNIAPQGLNIAESSFHTTGVSIGKCTSYGKQKLSSSISFKTSLLSLKIENPPTEISLGAKQDQFNDQFYSYLNIPSFKESIRYSYLSTGLNMQYFLGEKQQTYFHSSIFYNFGGKTSQQVENFKLTQFGKYPTLNFDTLTISTQTISNGVYQFAESFISGMIGFGRDINLVKDELMLGLSLDYFFSQNLIPFNANKGVFIDYNDTVKFNSTLGGISKFNLNGFSIHLQLNYAF
jgi:hypothetical protein